MRKILLIIMFGTIMVPETLVQTFSAIGFGRYNKTKQIAL